MPNVAAGAKPVFFTRQLFLFTAVCTGAALLPIAVDPRREWMRPVIWLAVVLAYRWFEQTVFRPSPARGVRTGEWLFPLVYLGVTGSFLLPALEFALLPRPLSWPVLIAGIVLAVFGGVVRYRAIDTLGEQLSTHVEVREGHQLVDRGVFRHVRHPGSAAAMLFLLGAALILHAYFSIIYIVGFLWTVLLYRMFLEERHSAALLPGYREYMSRTKRMIPFLF